MPRNETTQKFADRVQDLISDSGKDLRTVAAKMGIGLSSLSNYQNAEREPSISTVAKFAKYFGVTSDYLVGLSNNKTVETAAIGKTTGLSDESINRVNTIYRSGQMEFINHLLCDPELMKVLVYVYQLHAQKIDSSKIYAVIEAWAFDKLQQDKKAELLMVYGSVIRSNYKQEAKNAMAQIIDNFDQNVIGQFNNAEEV